MVANDTKIFLKMESKGQLSIGKIILKSGKIETSQVKTYFCGYITFFLDKFMKLFLEISALGKDKYILEIPVL